MAILRQKRDREGRLSKTAAFKLGRISKLYKKLGQKLLAISLCVTMVLLGAPATTFAEEPTTFVTSATAHHWGRSDLRAYLNNGLTDTKTTWNESTKQEITTTEKNNKISSSASNNDKGYAEHFNQEECDLIKPFTYYTNVLDPNGNKTSTFATTDRFWIPCGYYDKPYAVSWSADDTSNREFESTNKNLDRGHVIPKSYFCTPNSEKGCTWLRSTYIENTSERTKLKNTICGEQRKTADPTNTNSVGAACKIDLSKIDLASVASAKDILRQKPTTTGKKEPNTPTEGNLGPETQHAMIINKDGNGSYGMYLKLKAIKNADTITTPKLTVRNEVMSEDLKELTLDYDIEDCTATNRYIVIQAYEIQQPNVTDTTQINETTSYVAAYEVKKNSKTNVAIDTSDWTGKLSSENVYAIRIWLEYTNDETTNYLPYVTNATKYIMKDNKILKQSEYEKKVKETKKDYSVPENPRLYAEPKDLQCSWGDLSALSDTDYNKVLAGTAADETGAITGKNPTNQKIYFGSYEVTEGGKAVRKPMEFWIAGREDDHKKTDESGQTIVKEENGDGTIDPNGNIMTLYQAKSVETKEFNSSTNDYSGKDAITLKLTDNQSGESYPEDKITFEQGETNLGDTELTWQHRRRTTAWTDGMPERPGIYEIRCFAKGADNYERTYSNVVTFNVEGELTSEDFTFKKKDADYDGETHPVKLVAYDTKNPEEPYLMLPPDLLLKDVNMTIRYKYRFNAATDWQKVEWSDAAPKNAGSYLVGIAGKSTGGGVYKGPPESETLNDDEWTFTIKQKSASYQPQNVTLTANYGDTLGSLLGQLKDKLGLPTGIGQIKLEGTWSWENDDGTPVGKIGENFFAANFKPKDIINYAWSAVVGWEENCIKLKDSRAVKVIVYQANPTYKSPEKPLTAVFGDELSELEKQLVPPEDINGATLSGSWSFADKYGKLIDKNTILNEFGEQEYTAVFEPTDSNYQTARIKFKVNVTADTSNWGSEEVRTDGKTQYVDAQGKTSVEMTSENLDENSILWLREESYDASAWYGIDLSGNAFDLDKGHRFCVQWLSPNDDDYQTYYSQLDDARKAEVEGNKGWIFLIGVEDHKSKTVQPRKPVKVYVQIGDDWDMEDLQGYYISSAQDEQVETAFVDNLAYPASTDTFGIMTLSHFSPYFIYDKLNDKEKAAFDALSDEEKAQLDAAAKELAAQQNEKTEEKSETKSEKNSSSSSPKTGDEITYFTISGLGLMMTLALGLMLNSKINRRKLDK